MNGIITGVQHIKMAREGVAVLVSDGWQCSVIGFGCVSFKII